METGKKNKRESRLVDNYALAKQEHQEHDQQKNSQTKHQDASKEEQKRVGPVQLRGSASKRGAEKLLNLRSHIKLYRTKVIEILDIGDI